MFKYILNKSQPSPLKFGHLILRQNHKIISKNFTTNLISYLVTFPKILLKTTTTVQTETSSLTNSNESILHQQLLVHSSYF